MSYMYVLCVLHQRHSNFDIPVFILNPDVCFFLRFMGFSGISADFFVTHLHDYTLQYFTALNTHLNITKSILYIPMKVFFTAIISF